MRYRSGAGPDRKPHTLPSVVVIVSFSCWLSSLLLSSSRSSSNPQTKMGSVCNPKTAHAPHAGERSRLIGRVFVVVVLELETIVLRLQLLC
ncbi:hypothetical protein Pla100_50190 [Neorhodopirellula pilleata]|uniref:Uncharacterized protein n=1 Tax=Neorhodopirellula pilleata TaxID=2714738 RepID=A0A5C5ZXB9_9BACT|nr:hypothetical protein Pla100_50190 [Neorhodopirellula pilleata]